MKKVKIFFLYIRARRLERLFDMAKNESQREKIRKKIEHVIDRIITLM